MQVRRRVGQRTAARRRRVRGRAGRGAPDAPADRRASPDDLYILYTGGTTGMPKGVLWRNADANVECFGGRRAPTHRPRCLAEADGRPTGAARSAVHARRRPLGGLRTWTTGGTVIVQTTSNGSTRTTSGASSSHEQLNSC